MGIVPIWLHYFPSAACDFHSFINEVLSVILYVVVLEKAAAAHCVEKQVFCSLQKYSVKTIFSMILCSKHHFINSFHEIFKIEKAVRVNFHKFHTVITEHCSRSSNSVLDHICLTLKSATPDDE